MDPREPFSNFVRNYLIHNNLVCEKGPNKGQPTLARINAKILDELYDRYEEKARAWEKAQRAKKRAPRTDRIVETIPPDQNEVKGYVQEMGYTFSVDRFMAYYNSNGWRVGKVKMVSWRAACRTFQGESPRRPTAAQNLNGDARSGGNPHQEPSWDWKAAISLKWPAEDFPNRERWELGNWENFPLDYRKIILKDGPPK